MTRPTREAGSDGRPALTLVIDLLLRSRRGAGAASRLFWSDGQPERRSTGQYRTFDVYETVLFRCTGSATSFYLLVANRILATGDVDMDATELVSLRQRAHSIAAQTAGRERRPVGIDDVLAALHQLLGAKGRHLARRMVDEELELEGRLTTTSGASLELIRHHRRTAGRIIYVSDMHLSSRFIVEQLRTHGLWEEGDHCYVSCEQGATKRGGTLFPLVLRSQGLEGRQVTHVGNDRVADGNAALRSGLGVQPFVEGNLNRYEQILDSKAAATGGMSGVMAGASRLARLSDEAADPRVRSVRAVSAGVGAPTLVAYLLWVFSEASRRGIRRLYFLSRVGQPLVELARLLGPRVAPEMDLRYLYGSRQSLNLPALGGQGGCSPGDVRWILTRVENNTVRGACRRVDLAPDEISDELRRVGLEPSEWDRGLELREVENLMRVLTSAAVRGLIADRADRQRPLVEAYLQNEGFLDDEPCGVVDLTGVGSQIQALGRFRSSRGLAAATGFHFVTNPARGVAPVDGGGTELRSYYADLSVASGARLPPGMIVLLEVFGAATHGTVLGYEEVGSSGQVQPLLADGITAALESWGIEEVRSTYRAFVDALELDPELVDAAADLRPVVADLIEELWTSPSRLEAATWGNFPYEPGSGIDDDPLVLGPPIGWRELGEVLRRRDNTTRRWFVWIEASRRGSSRPIACAFALRRAVKRIVPGW